MMVYVVVVSASAAGILGAGRLSSRNDSRVSARSSDGRSIAISSSAVETSDGGQAGGDAAGKACYDVVGEAGGNTGAAGAGGSGIQGEIAFLIWRETWGAAAGVAGAESASWAGLKTSSSISLGSLSSGRS